MREPGARGNRPRRAGAAAGSPPARAAPGSAVTWPGAGAAGRAPGGAGARRVRPGTSRPAPKAGGEGPVSSDSPGAFRRLSAASVPENRARLPLTVSTLLLVLA